MDAKGRADLRPPPEVNVTRESPSALPAINVTKLRYFLVLVCAAVLCIILTLGLWPFHSPKNGVTWLEHHNGLHFGKNSTVTSSGGFQVMASTNGSAGASLELWLQPERIWDSGTLLAYYRPGNLFQFSLQQAQTDLALRTSHENEQHRAVAVGFNLKDIFHRRGPTFITITSGVKGVSIYIDGVLAAEPRFPLFPSDFNGSVVLGNAPGQTDSWKGQLLGFAVYGRQLGPAQAIRHYTSWKQSGKPELAEGENNIALYLFDEHAGNIIRDHARSGIDLYIPTKYTVVEKLILEPFWTEFKLTRNYSGAAVKNIIGFVPFGFCFYALFLTLPSVKRVALLAVAMGTATSFTIEILQAFLPTRESGTTDIFTNTFGTWLGVLSFRLLMPALPRLFLWLPLPLRDRLARFPVAKRLSES